MMKSGVVRFKVLIIWFFAILFTAAHPVESKETFKEVEETEEVKLYFQLRKQVKQKPKGSSKNSFQRSPYAFDPLVSQESILEKQPRYIFYCSLIYYE